MLSLPNKNIAKKLQSFIGFETNTNESEINLTYLKLLALLIALSLKKV